MSPPAQNQVRKHKHHLQTLATGAKHEREYVLKTAPASLDPLLHKIAVEAVNGNLRIPTKHRTKTKIDGLTRYARWESAADRKRMVRPQKNGQTGKGFLSFLPGLFWGNSPAAPLAHQIDGHRVEPTKKKSSLSYTTIVSSIF